MDRKQLYADVTAEVVRQIKAGAGEWRMPWRAIAEAGQPVNALTHQPYRGGNHLLFGMVALHRDWSGHWATYKQWQTLGAQVRRGERATHGVKWSPVDRVDRETGETEHHLVPFCFSVFSAEQVDGWDAPERAALDTPERMETAEAFFGAIGADIRHGGNRAAYSPSQDAVFLPDPGQFSDAARYYSTSAHEHAHWTGHPRRLARDLSGRFGSDAYALEELVAELSAAFTCSRLGLSTAPRPDHAQYLASWLRVLRADASALFTAAAKAQAATDYLAAFSEVPEASGAGLVAA